MNKLIPSSEVVRRLADAARLAEPQMAIRSEKGARKRSSGARIRLPQQRRPSSLAAAVAVRQSHRNFELSELPADALATALCAAERSDARSWRAEIEAGCSLDLFVVIERVSGIAPAIYRFDSSDLTLERCHAPLILDQLVLQRELAAAPALLIAAASLDDAESRHGPQAYRWLLSRASSALYAAWLAALAPDIAGCLFAGLLAPASSVVRGDGVDRTALCALALGSASSTAHGSQSRLP